MNEKPVYTANKLSGSNLLFDKVQLNKRIKTNKNKMLLDGNLSMLKIHSVRHHANLGMEIIFSKINGTNMNMRF